LFPKLPGAGWGAALARVSPTLLLAAVGGALGIALRVPAGGIVGAVVVVGTANVLTGRVPQLPNSVRQNAQVLTGTIIGSSIGPSLLANLGGYLLIAIVMAFTSIAMGLAIGWWISRRTGLDPTTALFCFMPGGLSEMVLISQEMGGDHRLVAMVGLMRILATVVLATVVLGYLVLRR
jgi:membrane AbrB-like protein